MSGHSNPFEADAPLVIETQWGLDRGLNNLWYRFWMVYWYIKRCPGDHLVNGIPSDEYFSHWLKDKDIKFSEMTFIPERPVPVNDVWFMLRHGAASVHMDIPDADVGEVETLIVIYNGMVSMMRAAPAPYPDGYYHYVIDVPEERFWHSMTHALTLGSDFSDALKELQAEIAFTREEALQYLGRQ